MEEWRSIPGYEMLYEASNEGRIRSHEGKITRSARSERRVWKQRIMKQKTTANRFGRRDCRVTLWKDGEERTWLVARLIALTFCQGYQEGMTVNHIDGNSMNNHASNLEWCSRADNIKKAYANHLYSTPKRVALIDINGNERMFTSRAAASRFLGMTNGYISQRIKKCKLMLPSGYRIKPVDSTDNGAKTTISA